MKTYSPKPEHIDRHWYVLDATGQVLGRLATQAATLLHGKHKPIFAPHMDTGDHVIVVNAERVELTGGKEEKKIAYRHSGYPGGIKATPYGRLLAERPAFAVEKAIRGMLPKNRLGRAMIRKLHVVVGPEHPHAAQKPEALAAGERPVWNGLPAPRGEKERAPGTPVKERETKSPPKKPTARRTATKSRSSAKSSARKPTAKTTASKSSARSAAKKTTTTRKAAPAARAKRADG
jgi:large subunit ribosomal protein L13